MKLWACAGSMDYGYDGFSEPHIICVLASSKEVAIKRSRKLFSQICDLHCWEVKAMEVSDEALESVRKERKV